MWDHWFPCRRWMRILCRSCRSGCMRNVWFFCVNRLMRIRRKRRVSCSRRWDRMSWSIRKLILTIYLIVYFIISKFSAILKISIFLTSFSYIFCSYKFHLFVIDINKFDCKTKFSLIQKETHIIRTNLKVEVIQRFR